MTPFSSLRVLTRSGQGLLGQSEELDELMAKILGDEIKEGRATKIQDDIIIGGQDQMEAINNYIQILEKFHLSNLRAEPEKTIIFPETADISGWVWKKGGYISVSPHRRNSLINTEEDDIDSQGHEKLHRVVQNSSYGHSKYGQVCNTARGHGARAPIKGQV